MCDFCECVYSGSACLCVNMNVQTCVCGFHGCVCCGAKPRVQSNEGNQSGSAGRRRGAREDGGMKESSWIGSSGNVESFLGQISSR